MKILLLIYSLFLLGCSRPFFDEEPSPNAEETFNYLWKECDEKYSFFKVKGIDWAQKKEQYGSEVYNGMPQQALFDILFDMLHELRDGHVNLISAFQVARFDIGKLGPKNFDDRLLKDFYLSDKYYITGGLSHDLFVDQNIAYVRYSSFSSSVTNDEMNFILNKYKNTEGLIFDVRANGGGSVTNVFNILGHFIDHKTFIYDSYIKTGKGHEDFSGAEKAFIEPSNGSRYFKPVVVLTDRGSYSATSFFSLGVRAIENMTIIGDTTGGGLGAPNGGQLPNGWTYRFSITQTISHDGKNLENGVPPDIQIDLDPNEALNGIDTILERAISFIKTGV
jgi:hypothetical protein